jgi:hypothetical protein
MIALWVVVGVFVLAVVGMLAVVIWYDGYDKGMKK